MSRGSSEPRAETRAALARELQKFTGLGASLFRAAAARTGMAVTDLQVLELLESDGPATAGELADRTGLTTGAITGMLNRLEEAGLIQRERDPDDGRRVIVRLAPAAASQQADPTADQPPARAVFAALNTAWDDLAASYDDERIALLLDFLTRANEQARQELARLREGPESAGGNVSAPLGDLRHARLVVAAGMSRLTVRAGAGMTALYEARFEGPPPEVRVEDGTVTIRYPRRLLGLGAKPRAAEVTLNAAILWEIAVQGNALDVTTDLTGLDLARLELKGSVSMIHIELPAPTGQVPVYLGGAASSITVRRPAGVAARVHLKGWVSTFTFDDQRFSNFGNNERLQSADYPTADRRYDIEVASSASTISITAG